MYPERTPITGLVSMFGENRKEGRWDLPRHMRVLAVFGSARVDLRDAIVQPGVSVIEVLTVFGNIEVIVPPGIIVECDGDAFLATFTVQRSKRGAAASPPPIDAPIVRVTGNAYAASVTIQVKARKERSLGKTRRKLELEG
jgi:hypothetical protein